MDNNLDERSRQRIFEAVTDQIVDKVAKAAGVNTQDKKEKEEVHSQLLAYAGAADKSKQEAEQAAKAKDDLEDYKADEKSEGIAEQVSDSDKAAISEIVKTLDPKKVKQNLTDITESIVRKAVLSS